MIFQARADDGPGFARGDIRYADCGETGFDPDGIRHYTTYEYNQAK